MSLWNTRGTGEPLSWFHPGGGSKEGGLIQVPFLYLIQYGLDSENIMTQQIAILL